MCVDKIELQAIKFPTESIDGLMDKKKLTKQFRKTDTSFGKY